MILYDIGKQLDLLIELFNEAFVKGDIMSLKQIEKKFHQIIDDPVWIHNINSTISEHKKDILKINIEFNNAHKSLLDGGTIKNIDEFNESYLELETLFKRHYEQAIMNYWETIGAKTIEYMKKENKKSLTEYGD